MKTRNLKFPNLSSHWVLRLPMLLLIPAIAFLASCNDDDDNTTDPDPVATQNIVELASDTPTLSVLVDALDNYSDLIAALSDDAGTFTVFAPTDAAMTAALGVLGYEQLSDVPADLLKEILKYHVISGSALKASDLTNGQVAPTLLANESVTVSITGSTVKINSSTVTTADVMATNGVVHIIDAVLIPSYLVTDDIVEIASATGDLSVLVSALGKFDDLVATLSDNAGTFTVFAPTNAAFTEALGILGYASLDDIPEDLLKQILQYHVIAGASLKSTDLNDGQEANTVLTDEKVTVSIDGTKVMINDATVTGANVMAVNGTIHIIDKVLLPSFIKTETIVALAQGNDDLSILVTALTKFPDLVSLLSDKSGAFTVFAPTNAAFADLLGVVGQSELDDIPEDVLKRILQYHVISGTVAKAANLSNNQMIATALPDESVKVTLNGSTVMIDAATVAVADVEAINGVVHVVDAVLVPSLEASIVNTVVEPAYFNKDFTTLTAAVVKAELLTTLIDKTATFTVFAPTNAAFEAAGITSLDDYSKADLEPILLYHVLGIKADKAAVAAIGTGNAVTTLGGDVYLSINDNGIFLNGTTEVVATDIQADNGVVHVIDRTLIPASNDIIDIAVSLSTKSEGAEFGQLVAALTAVENDMSTDALITILKGDGPFTVFAPTDAAFGKLYTSAGVADFSALVAAQGIGTIEAVLKYHVVSGLVFSTDLPNLSSTTVTTLGGDITLNLSNLTIADTDAALGLGSPDATIIDTDILGTNGVIHVIDEVLLP